MAANVTVPPFDTAPDTVVGATPQSVFPFDFPFWDASDILIYIDGELLAAADYSVEGLFEQDGEDVEGGYGSGVVTLDDEVSNCTVTVDRFVTGDRESQFSRSSPLPMTALNADLNRIVARQQDLARRQAALVDDAEDAVYERISEEGLLDALVEPAAEQVISELATAIAGTNVTANTDLPVAVGVRRNLAIYTEDLSWAYYTVASTAAKSTSDTVLIRDEHGTPITLSKVTAGNFYANLQMNLGSAGQNLLTSGQMYLMSFFVRGAPSQEEQFFWSRSLGSSGDAGHGAKLLLGQTRRVWALVVATSATTVRSITDPTEEINIATTGGETPRLFQSGNFSGLSAAFTFWMGGIQFDLVDTATKTGVIFIGNSTFEVNGADAQPNTSPVRYFEGYKNVTAFNRGVAGERLDNYDTRWATSVTAIKGNAKYVVCGDPINDITQGGRTLSDMQTSVNSMVAKAAADSLLFVATTCPPCAASRSDSAKETLRQSFNSWIRATFKLLLDRDAILRDPENVAQLNQLYVSGGDQTHPNQPGRRVEGEAWADADFWVFTEPTAYQKIAATTFTPAASVVRGAAGQLVGQQGAAVADATDAASAITQLNVLLARLRAHGLIAP